MARTRIAAVFLTILIGVLTSHAAETNRPVIAIYNSDWRLGSRTPAPQIIAALWTNGTIIWSATNAGSPYRQGRFAPDKLAVLLNSLERKGTFTNQTLTRAHFGPDSRFTTIAIDDGQRRLKMQSWHELFEQNTNLVATDNGIQSLAGRNREEVLRRQPASYKDYRNTWSEIRQAVTALIPPDGEPYPGELHIPK
jgi:hypothetical protein